MNDPMYFMLVMATAVAVRFAWRKWRELQNPQDDYDSTDEYK